MPIDASGQINPFREGSREFLEMEQQNLARQNAVTNPAVTQAQRDAAKEDALRRQREEELLKNPAFQQFSELTAPTIRGVDFQTESQDDIERLRRSALENINEDPRLRQAQRGTLRQLEQIGREGFTDADRAAQERIAREEAVRERGQREALLRNAAARGVQGSGLELASQLQAQQGSADRAAIRGGALAEQGQNRRLAAIRDAGQFATNVRGQEFGQEARVAQAQDAIRQFNAQQFNQAVARDQQAANQQQVINRTQVPQQQFNNQLALEQARANAIQGQRQLDMQRPSAMDRFGQAVDIAGGIAGIFK